MPDSDWISVVSVVSRESTSPVLVTSKNAGSMRMTRAYTALRRSATTRSPIQFTRYMRKRGERGEHRGGHQQPQEIAVDGGGVRGAEALVDDVLERLRQRQHGGGGHQQREKCHQHAPAIRREERQQRAERF